MTPFQRLCPVLVLTYTLLQTAPSACAQSAATATLPPLTLSQAIAEAEAAVSDTKTTQALAQSAQALRHTSLAPERVLTGSIGTAPSQQYASRPQATALYNILLNSPALRRGTLAVAQADIAVSTASLTANRFRVARSTVSAFFAIVSSEALLRSDTESIALAERSLSAAEARHHVGVAPLVDVVRAQYALETIQAQQAQAQAQLTGDQQALAVLLTPSGTPVSHVSLPIISPPLIGHVPSAKRVMQEASAISPAEASAQAALAAADAADAVARAQLQPSYSLGAGLEFHSGRLGPAIAVGASFPLDDNLLHADIAAADATTAAARSQTRDARQAAVQAALSARAVAMGDLAPLSALKTAYQSANDVAQRDLAAYRLGAVTSADLVLAQQQAASARANYYFAQAQAAQAVALMQLDLGGLVK